MKRPAAAPCGEPECCSVWPAVLLRPQGRRQRVRSACGANGVGVVAKEGIVKEARRAQCASNLPGRACMPQRKRGAGSEDSAAPYSGGQCSVRYGSSNAGGRYSVGVQRRVV